MSDMRSRLGEICVALYPAAWRARYQPEILALIEDDPPHLSGLASLLLGAVDAHLRPRRSWSSKATPQVRMRLSLCGAFTCWILLSVAGLGFQRETEEPAFAAAGHSHPILALAHGTVLAGAALGAAAIAFGGLPLVWAAARTARARRDTRLVSLLALPLLATAAFAALTLVLAAIAPAAGGHPSFPLALAILGPWWLGGLLCAITFALAPRMVLARIAPSPGSMRRAARATVALVAAMCLVTGGLVVYGLGLALVTPRLSGQSGGPLWPSTGAVIMVAAGLALLSTVLAGLSSHRAVRASASP
jgi:hypothetical protein